MGDVLVIVVISGTGGTGKTRVAKALLEQLDKKAKRAEEKYKLVDLNALAARMKTYIRYDKPRKTKIVNLKKLKVEIRKLKKKHKNLIIEGLFAHEFKADVVIILRCDPRTLERRLRKKHRWPTKITENVEAELMSIITGEALKLHGRRKVFEIDTTKRTAKQTARIIVRIISKRPGRYKAGKIDWLSARLIKSISRRKKR